MRLGLFLVLGIILKKRKIFNGEILFPLHICLIQNTYITSIYRKYSFLLKTLSFFGLKKKSKMGKRIKCLNLKLIFFDELIAIRGCRFGTTTYGQQ